MPDNAAKAAACTVFLRGRIGAHGDAHAFAQGWEAAKADSLAAEHRADLARQNEHYTAQPMNDDTGRDAWKTAAQLLKMRRDAGLTAADISKEYSASTEGWCEHYAPPSECRYCPESPTAEAHPPAPATTPGIDTPAPPTPAKPADGRTEPQGENA